MIDLETKICNVISAEILKKKKKNEKRTMYFFPYSRYRILLHFT